MSSQLSQDRYAGLIGPWVVSTIVSSLFTGVNVVQAHHYFNNFDNDQWSIRMVATASITLNIVSFILDSLSIWMQTVVVDRVANLNKPLWPAAANLAPIVVVATLTQIFFAHRAYHTMNRNAKLKYALGTQISITCALGITLIPVKLSVENATFLHCLQGWMWLTTATDVTITSVLAYALKSQKPGLNTQMNAILAWLFKSSLSTNATCSFVAICDAVISLTSKTNAHLPFTHVLPRVYTMSLFHVLNSRSRGDLRIPDRSAQYFDSCDPPHPSNPSSGSVPSCPSPNKRTTALGSRASTAAWSAPGDTPGLAEKAGPRDQARLSAFALEPLPAPYERGSQPSDLTYAQGPHTGVPTIPGAEAQTTVRVTLPRPVSSSLQRDADADARHPPRYDKHPLGTGGGGPGAV